MNSWIGMFRPFQLLLLVIFIIWKTHGNTLSWEFFQKRGKNILFVLDRQSRSLMFYFSCFYKAMKYIELTNKLRSLSESLILICFVINVVP